MKKKVYVDLFYLNTALTGIKTYMLEFVASVKTYPHPNIEFIFSHDPDQQSQKNFFRGKQPKWKTLLYHVYYFLWKQILLPWKAWISGADCIINFDFVGPALTSKKNFTVIHDAFFWQMPQNYSSWWRKYFIHMIYGGLKKQDVIITTSEVAKKAIQTYTLIGQIPHVIYQCPNLYEGNGDEKILSQFGLKENGFFFHLGSFDKRKNLPILIHAFAQFLRENSSEIKLVLAGERGLGKTVDDWETVEDTIRSYGLENKVILPGFISDAAAKTLYETALVYVFPSQNEGFGIPVIESMRLNTPVLISSQEALVEIAGGAALIHQTGNAVDLKEKMESLYRDPELRKQLIELGKARKEVFGRKAFADAYHRLILTN
ncbi:MAG: glycosyltransferase family 4 protein [Mongoliitalea sp.]